MPQSRAGRLAYALLIVALLLVIGRNVHRRYLNYCLSIAVRDRNPAAVRALLDDGADPNVRVTPDNAIPLERPALAWALMATSSLPPNAEEIACLLVQHGAKLRVETERRQTISNYLVAACQSGSPRVARCLLEHGADPNPPVEYYNNPMDLAISYRTVPRRLTMPFSPNHPAAKPNEAQRLQDEAEGRRRQEISRELIGLLRQHGVTMSMGQMVRANDVEGLRARLDAGTPADATPPLPVAVSGDKMGSRKGPTALMDAASTGSLQIAQLLIKRGANVNAVMSDNSYTPLMGAISGQHLEMARLLLQKGANVNAPGKAPAAVYSTPLVSACYSLPQIVPELLARGADVKATNGMALSEAIRAGHPELVTLLLKHGVSVRGREGHSALASAIQYQPELVPFLLAQGADARSMPGDGFNLISQAVQHGRKELIVPLLRAGAPINFHPHAAAVGGMPRSNSTTAIYSTCLIDALPHGADVVDLLLQHGANPNMQNSQGFTPLIIAAQMGNVEEIRLLLAYGAKMDDTGKMRHTPLYYARRHKRQNAAEILQKAGGHEK